MKFVTISQSFLNMCSEDIEILKKSNRRPHVLVLSLMYKGRRRDFAIPLRSNIPPGAPKNQYYSLPPRKTTKPNHRHGLHYIKMFPVKRCYLEKFWTGESGEYVLYQTIISKNRNQIIRDCQKYLYDYEHGKRPAYSVDIDYVLSKLED